jgi:hypothetical protein
MERILMAPKRPGYIGAKSIPDLTALRAVYEHGRPGAVNVLHDWPAKVVGAKLRKLEKRGWVSGRILTDEGVSAMEHLAAGLTTFLKNRGDAA